jgi:serine phosphatase RsbU (regulator of sigma subunit)
VPFDGSGLSGDWCDLRPHSTNETVVVIADVVGCGAGASAAKRELRPALRELAMRREHPSVVLEALDRVASETGAGMATMIYGVIDPPGGRVELFNVGHPPPLMIDPGGVASYLECNHFPPLGTGLCHDVTSSACYLQPGSTLILYTDGLVERRGEDLSEGLRHLQELANGAHRRSVEEICDVLLDARFHGQGAEDDITILALRPDEDDPAPPGYTAGAGAGLSP